MRNFFAFILLLSTTIIFAQTVKEANIYPSNLEENMYFEKYDLKTMTISGLYFMVLCDGTNSEFVTPAFEISIYLLPQGSTTKEDLIIIKRYSLNGVHHFGNQEFKNEKISIEGVEGLKAGTYRLGIWVNSNNAFNENGEDNAMLFKNSITLDKTLETKSTLDSPAKKIDDSESSESS